MTSENWDDGGLWCSLHDVSNELGGSDDIERGDSEELLWVVDSSLLVDLLDDRDSRVDRVGDDEHVCIWAVLGTSLCKVSDDRSIRVEEIVSGHTWLSWNSGWDDDDFGTGEGLLESVIVGTVS